MRFLLGAHQPHWLGLVDVPLMVSHRTLARRRWSPQARGPWALDSGAFSEIAAHGRFTTSPRDYVAAVRRYHDEIGHLVWAAPQDWMCEPFMVRRTGLDVATHQQRTIASVLDLRSIAPELPWIPVLQGRSIDDYRRHVEAYLAAGVDLAAEPLVGLGSVCRRQATSEIDRIVTTLAGQSLRLHGFGVKIAGLGRYGWALASADSLAWSYAARREPALPGHRHKNCANCLAYALAWRERVVRRPLGHHQLTLEIAA